MYKIVLDAMGGDNAPDININAALRFTKEFTDCEVVLVGQSEKIEPLLPSNYERISIVDAREVIEMDESIRTILRRKETSIVKGIELVRDGKGDAFVSNGSTGAVLAGATLIIGRLDGIHRPALAAIIPSLATETPTVMLDVGANADVTPRFLHQFGVMGEAYAKSTLGIKKPKICMLNNGAEAKKGTPIHKEAYAMLEEDKNINFIGNIEGREVLVTEADVIVADGFSGNVALKTVEGTTKELMRAIKKSLLSSFRAKIGALFIKSSLKGMVDKYYYSKHGGAVMLGLKAPVIKGHGSSNEEACYHCLIQARATIKNDLINVMAKDIAKGE